MLMILPTSAFFSNGPPDGEVHIAPSDSVESDAAKCVDGVVDRFPYPLDTSNGGLSGYGDAS